MATMFSGLPLSVSIASQRVIGGTTVDHPCPGLGSDWVWRWVRVCSHLEQIRTR